MKRLVLAITALFCVHLTFSAYISTEAESERVARLAGESAGYVTAVDIPEAPVEPPPITDLSAEPQRLLPSKATLKRATAAPPVARPVKLVSPAAVYVKHKSPSPKVPSQTALATNVSPASRIEYPQVPMPRSANEKQGSEKNDPLFVAVLKKPVGWIKALGSRMF
jgi:hypothetical protein